jgi:gamma-glutamyl-gamma-aminobutyrate hydrolase PuuD
VACGAEVFDTNANHHQAADPGFLPNELVSEAETPDHVVEALAWRGGWFCKTVQWHPEEAPVDVYSRRLFRSHFEEARSYNMMA